MHQSNSTGQETLPWSLGPLLTDVIEMPTTYVTDKWFPITKSVSVNKLILCLNPSQVSKPAHTHTHTHSRPALTHHMTRLQQSTVFFHR